MTGWNREADSPGVGKNYEKRCQTVAAEVSRQAKAICRYLKKLKTCEFEKSPDLDRTSGDTGEMLGEIFVWKEVNGQIP